MKQSNIDSILPEPLFWSNNIRSYFIRLLQKIEQKHIMVYSDASDRVCRAFTIGIDDSIFHSMRSESESKRSSTWRELKAIEQALLSFADILSGKTVKWMTDNQNCVIFVEIGSMKIELQDIAFKIFRESFIRGISIDMQWVPRDQNALADYISKMIDHEDWGVTDQFFQFIDSLWGPHTVDRFASLKTTNLVDSIHYFRILVQRVSIVFSQNGTKNVIGLYRLFF